MQFVTGMTVNTVHPPLAEVNIARVFFIFPEVFVTYTAAVAGGTGLGHRRGFREKVAVKETTPYRIRLADVAIATGSVAA